MKPPMLFPGDIVFVRTKTGWFSKLIRLGSRTLGEGRTIVNHVGVIVNRGRLLSDDPLIVESLDKTRMHPLNHQYLYSESEIAIFRHKGVTVTGGTKIAEKAMGYVGKEYGWWKIAMHTLDYLFFFNRPVFRRLAISGDYPICSWVVAVSYKKAVDVEFGIDPRYASPDDMWDHVLASPDWVNIKPLSTLR